MALYVGERIFSRGILLKRSPAISLRDAGRVSPHRPKSNKTARHTGPPARPVSVWRQIFGNTERRIRRRWRLTSSPAIMRCWRSNKTRGAGIYALRRTGDSRHADPHIASVPWISLADSPILRRGESLSDAAVWFADHAGAGGGDQQPAAEKLPPGRVIESVTILDTSKVINQPR
ncbi:hypothetical protein KCP77_22960 [Salmonella enterica subsp. enterica]|nr:hypothetical protein KCP77_22960 [Salmonella enterica subsp. enterica]